MPSRLKFLLGLIAFTIVLRLLPYVLTNYDMALDPGAIFYPWNFSPLMAVSLFAGANLTDRRLRFGLPLLMMFISDLGIWGVTGQFSWGFPGDRWSAYVCCAVAVVLGSGLNGRPAHTRPLIAVGRGLLSEVLFFVVTNFVYFWYQSDLPHTVAGLMACYVAAIPFAGRSFISTAFYSGLLFSPLADRIVVKSSDRVPEMRPVRSV